MGNFVLCLLTFLREKKKYFISFNFVSRQYVHVITCNYTYWHWAEAGLINVVLKSNKKKIKLLL